MKLTNVQDVTGDRSLTPQVHVEDPTVPSTHDRAVPGTEHEVSAAPSTGRPRRLTGDPAAAPVTSGVMAEIAARSYRGHVYVSEISVDHTEMMAAIAANDVTGVSTVYDRYGEGLYTYCRSRLSQPADAADAVQNAFINASAKVSELTQPNRLQAWLFAVARYECQLRLRDAVPSAQLQEAARQRMTPGHLPLYRASRLRRAGGIPRSRTRHARRAGPREPGDQRAEPAS